MQKRFYLLIVLLLILSAACSQEGKALVDCPFPPDADLAGTWKVVAFEDSAANTRVVQDSANSWGGLEIVLTFRENRITGQNTTNQVLGTFSVPGPGQVRIEKFGGTEINEPMWGRMFGEAVYQFSTYRVKDRNLTFYYNGCNNRVTLEKQ